MDWTLQVRGIVDLLFGGFVMKRVRLGGYAGFQMLWTSGEPKQPIPVE